MPIIIYFAYGSNMNEAQMKVRCPSSKKIGIGQVLDYRLVYDGSSTTWKGAVCNIVSDKNKSVWGILYEVDSLSELDHYEGYQTSYQRKELSILMDNGKIVNAIAYYREGWAIGEPSKEYRDLVKAAAEKAGLSAEYIQKNI